jgi:hypothetical protein
MKMGLRLDNVFRAEPKGTWSFLQESAQGLYIPAYQRSFSWEKDKVKHFLDNAASGLNQLIDNSDSITFIGTVITIQDTEYKTINPIVRAHVPRGVLTIIDGQQRLSTLLLVYCISHDMISTYMKKFEEENDAESVWIKDQAKELLAKLHLAFEMDMTAGDRRFYPRMIRAFHDQWSKDTEKAKYTTPIAFFLHKYGNHIRSSEPCATYNHDIPDGLSAEEAKEHNHVKSTLKVIRNCIENYLKDSEDIQNEIPSSQEISRSGNLQKLLANTEFSEEIVRVLNGNRNNPQTKCFQDLMRLLVYVSFINERVALTVVTAQKEDYAFDMFEALNTTGEPLTAFETFKPRVIEAEGLGEYKDSPSYPLMEKIESLLNGEKLSERHKATSELVIPFSLAESAYKCSKKLNDQRRYLRENYTKIEPIEGKRQFLQHLSDASEFLYKSWKSDLASYPNATNSQSPESLLALDFLKKAKHHITMGPLIRYYSWVSRNPSPQAFLDFEETLKTFAAFFALWRGSRTTTQSIDSVYRELMSTGFPSLNIHPLNRAAGHPPNLQSIRKFLVKSLIQAIKIGSKEDWITQCASNPVYKTRDISRLLLIAANHDSTVDTENHGMLMNSRPGYRTTLTLEQWQSEKYRTLEHIAPVTKSEEWDGSIYEDPTILDRLGNLTLLPKSSNSSIQNVGWEKKKLYYSLLSATSTEEFDAIKERASAAGLDLSNTTIEIIDNTNYMHHLSTLKNVSAWTVELINIRSKNIASIAWDRLIKWMGVENPNAQLEDFLENN